MWNWVLISAMARKRVILCGLVLAWVCVLESHSSFFVARRYREDKYYCVTNTTFAMSWIIETITEGLQQNSNYIPESRSSFNYDIKNDQKTKKYFVKHPWSLQSSAFEVILDERWEKMEVIKTEFVDGNNKLLKFVPVELSTANFDIALSIRIEKEGHIFLCDGEYPSESNCYWLMLEAFSGTGSAIRKCYKGQVSSKDREYPKEPCSQRRVFVNHTLPQFPNYLSNLEWSHFVLSKEDRKLTFSLHSDDNKIYKILEWQDTETPIDVTHMVLHSKMVNGLWKIHKIDYIGTTIETNEIEFGPPVSATEGFICISMYVSMCQFCKLKLSLRRQYSIINNMIYEAEHAGWNQIKFVTQNLSNDGTPMQLLVSTVSGDPHPYWAIDKIRFCRQEEFRKIGLTEEASCQLMSGNGNVITFQEQPVISDSNCPENTIGPFCVKCDLIFDNCEKTTICTKDGCVCSAGYYSRNCYYECSGWKYGHGCKKPCGNCYDKCNNIEGTCDPCSGEYSGPKCDIPPAIIFANPPTVTDITYDGATISVSDFEIANRQNDQQPSYYLVQYKNAEGTNSTWIYYNKTFRFNEPSKFKINNLNAQTEYLIRSVIVTTTGPPQIGEHLKFTTFTTTCQDISDDNIFIEPYNTSVSITLIQTTHITCKSYRMSLIEIQRHSFVHKNGTTSFINLEPFTEYTLKIQGPSQTHTKKFMTTEGVPAPIQSFIISDLTSSSVELKWSPPKLNGQFKEYVVEYQHISYTACGSNPSPTSTISKQFTTETGTVLTDLKPYSTYQISVFAVNTKFDGPPHTKQVKTSAANTVDLEEIPKIFNITSDHKAANLELTEMNCEKIRGPLTIKPTIKCISEWCTDQNREAKTEITYSPTSLITLYSLAPFSEYEVELKFCRGTGPCDFSENKTFKTRPTVPREVQDLLIYTKNETSISFRWKPPTPPTGNLKKYKIIYRYFDRFAMKREVSVEPAPCELWAEFHCATLSDLVGGTYYTIVVSARNEDPADFGPSQETATLTKTEKSRAPYDLKVNWSQQNDLLLEWKHPNQTNGDIQYFNITISLGKQQTSTKKLNITNGMYNLTYFYQINATEFTPTRTYTVSVFAFNDQAGYKRSESTMSPPDIPTLSNDPEFKGTNDTIQVTLSLNEPQGANKNYRLIVLRTEYDAKSVESLQELKNYDLQNLRLVLDCDISVSSPHKLVLGDDQETKMCSRNENPPLKPATEYNITIILINTYNDYRRDRIYSYSYRTLGEPVPGGDSSLLALLSLLLLIPIAAFLYFKRDELKSLKTHFFKQNINSSTEVLEIQDDQIPLSNVPDGDNKIQVAQKPKVQPRVSVGAKVHSKPVKITEFEEYVKESIKNGELERQHALFPRGQTKPWAYGSLKENKSKNRYNNLIAYDHSRVILEKIDGHPHSDYINANYIDGYKMRKAYIATQGPKVATLDDFWRMVWQENVRHIANLANIYEGGKKKVEKYWPDINESLKFGDITVQYLSRSVFADYEHRVFTVTHNDECRKIDQLHFTSWPDHGVPLYSQSLVPFLQKILQIPITGKSPILVHCSAGVGRTGTILLCDICLRMAAREGAMDLLRYLQILRNQRPNMVDNIEQYKLAHLVVLECLVGMHTSIPCNELEASVGKVLENGSLVVQMRYLKDTQWQDQAMKTVGQTGEEALVVREKNRFENIVPEIQGRVFLTRNPASDETSSYINAVKVDGFRCPGRFIVTQQPLPNTVGDFWRLVHEYSTSQYSVVVSLNQISPKDKTCCSFWPTTAKTEMKPVPHITLKHVNTMSLEGYDVVTVHLYAEARKEFLPVQIIAMKKWAPKAKCPEKIEDFLGLWEQVDSSARGTDKIFVTCYDGVKASGLFTAMSFVIEKMKLEQVCDICQAVRNIRHNRPQFVSDLEQFEFLYKAAVLYINGFESYANFN